MRQPVQYDCAYLKNTYLPVYVKKKGSHPFRVTASLPAAYAAASHCYFTSIIDFEMTPSSVVRRYR